MQMMKRWTKCLLDSSRYAKLQNEGVRLLRGNSTLVVFPSKAFRDEDQSL
jgi:hypothetical protein